MNVIQICSYYINDRFYSTFFDSLKEFDINSVPYVFANINKKGQPSHVKNSSIFFCFNSFDRIFFHLKHWKVWKTFERNMDISDVECIHAHSLFSNGYIAYLIKKKYGVEYVVTVRYPDYLTFFKWMIHLRPLGRRILKNANKVIFLSESSKEETYKYLGKTAIENIENKVCIIPNGIEDFWITNKYSKKFRYPPKKKLTLLFVGRVNKNKNPEVLIKTCELLRAQHYDVKLNIVGDIEYTYYTSQFKKYEFIEHHDFCEKEVLLNHYRCADIFIMLSHKETFGLVYAEAMSQGLPLIYSRGQGFDQQFSNGEVGYACKNTCAEEAVHCIEKILEDYSAISRRCIENCDRFNWSLIAKQLANIYENTVEL